MPAKVPFSMIGGTAVKGDSILAGSIGSLLALRRSAANTRVPILQTGSWV